MKGLPRPVMPRILIFFHCRANTGYAIGRLEKIFFSMAEQLTNHNWSHIHFAYISLAQGLSTTLPQNFTNIIEFQPSSEDSSHGNFISEYIKKNQIDVAFGFDQPVRRKMYKYLRRGGIKHFVSYWGAPISSLKCSYILWLKKLEVTFSRFGPDLYIFESQGMADTAIYGRGISQSRTSIVYPGVDPQSFSPSAGDALYVYDIFSIPHGRRIFFFSGHMEERKGVHILIKAVRLLVEEFNRQDFHVVILGNRNNEEQVFNPLMAGSIVSNHVTFGGYRTDVARLLRGCYAGVIASTGWDSFTLSSLEMAATGLPLIVSSLPGLRETIKEGVTGYLFQAGNENELARRMLQLLNNEQEQALLGSAARERIIQNFTEKQQIKKLVKTLRDCIAAQ